MRIVGVDPGMTGAIACIDSVGPRIVGALDMQVVDIDRSMAVVDEEWLIDTLTSWSADAVAVERQGPIYDPKRGRLMRGSSVAKLGMVTGSVIAICRLAGRPIHYLTPGSWKTTLALAGKPKDKALDRARALFPEHEHFRHGRGDGTKACAVARAEAALIAWACWLRNFAARAA